MRTKHSPFLLLLLLLFGCGNTIEPDQTVLLIPVYGQSLALGEGAKLITNFNELTEKFDHRVYTQNLDEKFGFYSNSLFKQKIKSLIGDHRRTFEVSCYGLAESLLLLTDSSQNNKSFTVCTFPEGQGASGIDDIGIGSDPFNKLLKEIQTASDKAKKSKCSLIVPAICWIQGENDVVWGTGLEYKKKLQNIISTLNTDIKLITGQKSNIKCVLYQTNCLSISENKFQKDMYNCPHTRVPMDQLGLIQTDTNFVSCGPSYPYSTIDEYVHLDGLSQKFLGYREGLSVANILKGKKSTALIPENVIVDRDTIIISFNVPYPPLVFDTASVSLVDNYGFSVITEENRDIVQNCSLKNDKIYIHCSEPVSKAKLRYAVNGDYWKGGRKYGSRGNLRDSQGKYYSATINRRDYPIDNWCYMFDIEIEGKMK